MTDPHFAKVAWPIVSEREGLPRPGDMAQQPEPHVAPYPILKCLVVILGLSAAGWAMIFIVGRAVAHWMGWI